MRICLVRIIYRQVGTLEHVSGTSHAVIRVSHNLTARINFGKHARYYRIIRTDARNDLVVPIAPVSTYCSRQYYNESDLVLAEALSIVRLSDRNRQKEGEPGKTAQSTAPHPVRLEHVSDIHNTYVFPTISQRGEIWVNMLGIIRTDARNCYIIPSPGFDLVGRITTSRTSFLQAQYIAFNQYLHEL